MAVIRFWLSWPVKQLWENERRGKGYQTRYSVEHISKSEAYGACLEALGRARPRAVAAALIYTFWPPQIKRFDVDGAYSALKHAQDGIAQALDCDDSVFWPVILSKGPVMTPRGRVHITIEYLERAGPYVELARLVEGLLYAGTER